MYDPSYEEWYVGAPRGPLHGGHSTTGVASRGPLDGGVADLFYTDVRSILTVLWCIQRPRIKGFKTNLRQRYPIMPIHEHGTTSWKEVKALQDIMIDAGGSSALRASLDRIREERIGVSLKLMYTTGGASNVGPHEHALHVTGEQVKQMDEDGFIEMTSSMDNGHTHSVKLARETIEMSTGVLTHRYKLLKCDQGQLCGDEDGYRQHYDAMHAAVMSEGPWAYYTDVESQYEVEDEGKAAVWRDMSGNERDSVRITLNGNTATRARPFKQHPAPYKQDTAPETASVVCNDEQGLLFPNGSIPSGKFTIMARAKYIKAEGMRQGRILRGSKSTTKTPEWYLGWAGYLGVASYSGTQIHNNGARIHDDTRYNFHTVVGRSTTTNPLWLDGVARKQQNIGSFPTVDDPNIALVIGALDATSGSPSSSDFAISDLIIFDTELSDEKIAEISKLMQSREKRPVQCCWDEHMGLKVESIF